MALVKVQVRCEGDVTVVVPDTIPAAEQRAVAEQLAVALVDSCVIREAMLVASLRKAARELYLARTSLSGRAAKAAFDAASVLETDCDFSLAEWQPGD